MTGQHNRQVKFLAGQVTILARHCLLTGRYFELCATLLYFQLCILDYNGVDTKVGCSCKVGLALDGFVLVSRV